MKTLTKLLTTALALGVISTSAYAFDYDFNFTTSTSVINLTCKGPADPSAKLPEGRVENVCTYREWQAGKNGQKIALRQTIPNGSLERGQGKCGGYTLWKFVSGPQQIIMKLGTCDVPGEGGPDDPGGIFERYHHGRRVTREIMY